MAFAPRRGCVDHENSQQKEVCHERTPRIVCNGVHDGSGTCLKSVLHGHSKQDKVQNPTAGQYRDQKSSETETIRGVIAAVTAEGEIMFDHRSNRAVAVEAAYLTVVGSPVRWEGNSEDKATATGTERSSSSGKKRHNVYIAWMTPRTKVCEASKESEKSGETQVRTQAQ